MPAYPTGPDTGLDRLQADLKRKAAQLNAADNQIAQLTAEGAAHKAKAAEAQAAAAAARNRADGLAAQLAAAQQLLKQRDVAVTGLSQQLESARSRSSSRPGSAANSLIPTPTAVLSAKTLSRQNSDEEALHAELAGKERRISELEAELAATKARVAALTPRRRDSVEDSGVAVVGGGSMASYDANRLRSLRAEAEDWRDKADGLMAQVRDMQRQLQAADIEKSQLGDQCATLSEKVTALESEVKASRESLSSLRAVADQGRGDLRSQLQRKDSDLARAAAAADAAAQQAEGLQAAAEKGTLERERLALQVQQLQAQLGKKGEEARDREARVNALLAQLDEQSAALEAAQAQLKDVSGGKWGAEAHLSDVQGRLEGLGKEKTEVENELRRTADALAAAEADKEALEVALREHRSRGDGAAAAADALRAQLGEARKRIEERERRLAEAVAALDDRQMELDQMQRASARGSESADALSQKLAAVAAQLATTKEELAQRNATLAELSTELELSREEATNQGKAAEDATAALRAGQGAIDRSRAHGSEEIAELQGFLAKANERAEELQGEVEARDAEIAALGARLSKMEDLSRQKHELSQKVLEGEGALRSAEGDAAGVAAELETARLALADRQAALEAARAALGSVERKATGLEQDLRQARAALATVEAQLSERDERLMEQERRMDAVAMEVADLRSELRGGELARQDLQRDLDASRLEVLHLQASVRGLEGESEAAQKRIRSLTDDLEDARAPYEADQEARRQLADARAELAAERAAHATTKQLLLAEAAAVAEPAAAPPQQEQRTPAGVEAALGGLQLGDAEQPDAEADAEQPDAEAEAAEEDGEARS